MIDSRWRKLQRDLWLHRGRSLLVIVAVAIAMIGGRCGMSVRCRMAVAASQNHA